MASIHLLERHPWEAANNHGKKVRAACVVVSTPCACMHVQVSRSICIHWDPILEVRKRGGIKPARERTWGVVANTCLLIARSSPVYGCTRSRYLLRIYPWTQDGHPCINNLTYPCLGGPPVTTTCRRPLLSCSLPYGTPLLVCITFQRGRALWMDANPFLASQTTSATDRQPSDKDLM